MFGDMRGNSLRFADDIDLKITDEEDESNESYDNSLMENSRESGMDISLDNTKYTKRGRTKGILENTLLQGKVTWNRSRGRPTIQWLEDVNEWTG